MKDGRGRRITGSRMRRRRLPSWRQRVTMPPTVTSPHSEPRRCHHERALVTKVCNVQGTKNLPAPTIAVREQSRHPDRSNVLANVCPLAVLPDAFSYLTSA